MRTMTVTRSGWILTEEEIKTFKKIRVFCASYAYSGVWAYSAEAVSAFAPAEMLATSEFSSGSIWEANLYDLYQNLWSFYPAC
jgi:hypothetical protein